MYLNSIKRRLNTPNDIKNLFNDYSLSICGLMTGATSNAKISKNLSAAMPPAVILHHLPDKQISAVINSDNAAETINRQYIAELSDLSKKFNLTNKLKNYTGCAYSSEGCRRSCLVFSGRSNPRFISEIFKNDSIIFYEYSKAPLNYLNRLKALGVDVTASLVADRPTGAADAISAVNAGYRLAVPVTLNKADRIPRRVIISDNTGRRVDIPARSFDNYDYRPADPQKCAGILKAKKSAGGDILSAFFVADKVGRQYIGGGSIEVIY